MNSGSSSRDHECCNKVIRDTIVRLDFQRQRLLNLVVDPHEDKQDSYPTVQGAVTLTTFFQQYGLLGLLSFSCVTADDLPDIRSVPPDIQVPAFTEGEPSAGKRIRQTLPDWKDTRVYHVLHLPENWHADGAEYPVLVEWAGNGGYSNAFGDVSIGRPEGSQLGYGLSAGRDFIWLCLPYLNNDGNDIAINWWGDPPTYDPEPTLRYCRSAVEAVCRDYRGDRKRVVLCGFSRGAIACNYLGLHDDETSRLWCGFIAYSHYDGARNWPYPGSDRQSARLRLNRLGDRPQFICSEGNGAESVREYLMPLVPQANLTFTSTGFRSTTLPDSRVPAPCRFSQKHSSWRMPDETKSSCDAVPGGWAQQASRD
mgnify:CR=1 FL=1